MRGAHHFVEVEHQARTRKRLAELWDEGHSMAEIGRRMGITKNAVAGLRHRMGLPSRPNPVLSNARDAVRRRAKSCAPRVRDTTSGAVITTLPPLDPPPALPAPHLPAAVLSAEPKRRPARKPKPPRKPRPPRSPPERAAAAPSLPASTACQWPLNDGENKRWRFCEDPRAEGAVYCEAHCALAYTGRVRTSTGGLVNYAWGIYA